MRAPHGRSHARRQMEMAPHGVLVPLSRPLWRAFPRAPRARTRPPSPNHPRDGSRRADRARRARCFTGKLMDASRWSRRPAQRSATVARATLRARLCHLGAMPSRCSAGVRRVRPTFTTHSRRTTRHESRPTSHSETSILKFGSPAARARDARATSRGHFLHARITVFEFSC